MSGREAMTEAILRHLFREPMDDDSIGCLCGATFPAGDWTAYAEHLAAALSRSPERATADNDSNGEQR